MCNFTHTLQLTRLTAALYACAYRQRRQARDARRDAINDKNKNKDKNKNDNDKNEHGKRDGVDNDAAVDRVATAVSSAGARIWERAHAQRRRAAAAASALPGKDCARAMKAL
jgi:hypothetical protein